jgi:putative SOS response-associated peptidase YedK
MCNLYQPSTHEKISMRHLVPDFLGDYGATVAPLKPGPIVLADRALVAQWGMIPPWSKTREPLTSQGRRMSTNNCRREGMASAPTFRDAWRKGRRCIIPAESYDEPNWTSGKNVWWRFWRADAQPWALAGIWSEWTDPDTGTMVPSYSMITQNCDGHPLLGLMHKPDPKLPADQQDKRSVVSLEPGQWDQWLNGTPDQAEQLIQVPALELFNAGPAQAGPPASLFT